MWRAAAGGGLIIGAMALLKILASKLALAPFVQAFVYSMNYGLGFMLIHMLHFTVATKQPAMTAAAIAATLEESGGASRDLQRLADLVVDVLRSQFAAICGNVLVAVPTAIAISLALGTALGHPPVDAHKAAHLLHELSPVRSLAVFHAVIAGVCLFLAGLISGYFDNLASYARIPERVVRLPWLRRLAGDMGAARAADYLGDNLGGLMGNLLFGFMLGSMGTLGFLFGLPLDIRHIAFSSANLGYALVALDFALDARQWLESLAGLFLIGFTNLAVSFVLALWVALKSRGAEFRHGRPLLGIVAGRFLRQPQRFLLPPAAGPVDSGSRRP
jgi:site-specific recombinase